jgi:uncharacterized membrane-anchored protein
MSRPKIPAVPAHFRAIRILTTGMGETTSDFPVGAMDPKLAIILGALALAAGLAAQILAPQFRAWI